MRSTPDQREVEAAVLKAWRRKYGSKSVPACEELRRQLRIFDRWLRGQIEALGKPVERAGTLREPLPTLNPNFPGEGILDVLCDVEEYGQIAARIAKRRRTG